MNVYHNQRVGEAFYCIVVKYILISTLCCSRIKFIELFFQYILFEEQNQYKYLMSFCQTPIINSYKNIASPTTNHTDSPSVFKSSKKLMKDVSGQLNDLIAQVQLKKAISQKAISAVYEANQQALQKLDPSRKLVEENQQLRKELNQALRQILRLRQIIGNLQHENMLLKEMNVNRAETYNLFSQLQQLKEDGQRLRHNVIGLLQNKGFNP